MAFVPADICHGRAQGDETDLCLGLVQKWNGFWIDPAVVASRAPCIVAAAQRNTRAGEQSNTGGPRTVPKYET